MAVTMCRHLKESLTTRIYCNDDTVTRITSPVLQFHNPAYSCIPPINEFTAVNLATCGQIIWRYSKPFLTTENTTKIRRTELQSPRLQHLLSFLSLPTLILGSRRVGHENKMADSGSQSLLRNIVEIQRHNRNSDCPNRDYQNLRIWKNSSRT